MNPSSQFDGCENVLVRMVKMREAGKEKKDKRTKIKRKNYLKKKEITLSINNF